MYPQGLASEKEVDIAILLSITTGRLLLPSGDFHVMAETVSWFVGESLYTQGVRHGADEVIPYLYEWYPQLEIAPSDIAAINKDNWQQFLADFREQWGNALLVAPIPADDHTNVDPVQSLIDYGISIDKIISGNDDESPYGTLPYRKE